MIKVINLIKGGEDKVKAADVRKRKSAAYCAGTLNHPYEIEYEFERESWLKGKSDDARLREEIRDGLR